MRSLYVVLSFLHPESVAPHEVLEQIKTGAYADLTSIHDRMTRLGESTFIRNTY